MESAVVVAPEYVVVPDPPLPLPVGRFSTGLEHDPYSPELVRVGSFATGCRQLVQR